MCTGEHTVRPYHMPFTAHQGPKETSSMDNPVFEYREASVAGEGQLKLIIMLYEGAARYLNLARENVRRNEIELAHNNLTKAKRIIVHFLSTTNPETSELAMNLHKLYIFLYGKISVANMRKNCTEIEDASRILNKLLEGWRELQQQTAPTDQRPGGGVSMTV